MKIKILAIIAATLGILTNSAFAQITSQFREITVDAMARDAIFDEDDVIVSDGVDTFLDGLFSETLNVTASTITGITLSNATQSSTINTSDNSFIAFSEIETRSQEDGSSSNSASSILEIDFDFPIGGTVDLSQLELTVSRSEINKDPQDDDFERSDDAFVSVVIADGVLEFVNETLVLQREDLGNDLSAPQTVLLPAGKYTLTVAALISGDDFFNTVQGQPRGSIVSYCVGGSIVAEILGDVNCDGSVNLLDVQPFVDTVSSGVYNIKADINKDGETNLLDVNGFVVLLGNS